MLYEENVKKKHRDWEKISELYIKAFPAEERVSLRTLRFAALRKGIGFTAYYDEGKFCGFTFSGENDKTLFVFFLAVDDKSRGKGYGSAILENLKMRAGERAVVLNVEPLDNTAPNFIERQKRFDFYKKNGFKDTGYSAWEVGGKFTVLSTAEELDVESYKKIFKRASYGFFNVRVEKV